MWAAQAEADVRTKIGTARLKGANPFEVIPPTAGPPRQARAG